MLESQQVSSASKKKILHIVEAMGGGVFTYMVELANQQAETYDVTIAYATRPQTPADYKTYFLPEIHLIEVESFEREINLKKDYQSIGEIKKIAKEVNPEVIHLHSSKAGVAGRIAFNGKKIPLFYTPHGYSFLMENCSAKKRFVYKAIEKVLGVRNCKTICCSVGEHQEAEKVTKKASFISNGITMKTLDGLMDNHNVPNSKETDKNALKVFTIGRICEQKNPQTYNEIAKALPAVQFLWIGDGELRDELTSENIQITGWVTREEAMKYALEADVFILPSLWEGLPISLLEAMYMKKVCIVSNVVGNRDVIESGRNGYVCDSPSEYVTVIQKLLEEAETVASSGKHYAEEILAHARADIEEIYNTIVVAQKYGQEYEEAIRG